MYENKCKCGKKGTPDRHSCPYDSDIHDHNDPEACNCCVECTNECADDI